jgi:hypothetical protein
VPLVGHDDVAALVQAQLRARHEREEAPPGVPPREAHDLDGQRTRLAQSRDLLPGLRDDDEALSRRHHEFLAQHRRAPALDQPELRVNLVGAVDGQCESHVPIEVDHLDAPLAQELFGASRCRRRADAAVAQQLQHRPDGTAGPEPDRHSRLDQFCSGCGCGGAGRRVQAPLDRWRWLRHRRPRVRDARSARRGWRRRLRVRMRRSRIRTRGGGYWSAHRDQLSVAW